MQSFDIRRLKPGGPITTVYDELLVPAFPPAELCSRDGLVGLVERGEMAWVALDGDGQVAGTAIFEWDAEPRVLLLAWLAVRPGLRGSGLGGRLLDAAAEAWRKEFAPCLVLAEVEDPDHHTGSDATGDPTARLRFYRGRGARVLDLPYFQAALGPDAQRVPDLLLIVLDADPKFHGSAPDTIDPAVLRRYLEIYQQQCEGQIGTDDQAMRLWQALDAQPTGVALR
jgi:GNAT superfamily N-acetyltransferase